jgi:hypothetical protein
MSAQFRQLFMDPHCPKLLPWDVLQPWHVENSMLFVPKHGLFPE